MSSNEARNPEESLRSLQFQWVAAQAKIERSEKQMREFRLTAVLFLVFLFGCAVFSTGGPTTLLLALAISATWWGMVYLWTILPAVYSVFIDTREFRYYAPGVIRDDVPGGSVDEQAHVVEEARYFARWMSRRVRMISLLVATGVMATIVCIVFVSLQFALHR